MPSTLRIRLARLVVVSFSTWGHGTTDWMKKEHECFEFERNKPRARSRPVESRGNALWQRSVVHGKYERELSSGKGWRNPTESIGWTEMHFTLRMVTRMSGLDVLLTLWPMPTCIRVFQLLIWILNGNRSIKAPAMSFCDLRHSSTKSRGDRPRSNAV